MPTPLDGAEYVSLETFKKDGTGVKTPVWAAGHDGALVIATDANSWKVKRIRNNPKVRVAACNGSGKRILGPWYDGTARILDPAAGARADESIAAKYGWKRRVFYFFSRLFGRTFDPAWISITLG